MCLLTRWGNSFTVHVYIRSPDVHFKYLRILSLHLNKAEIKKKDSNLNMKRDMSNVENPSKNLPGKESSRQNQYFTEWLVNVS